MEDETFLNQHLEQGSHAINYSLEITAKRTALRIEFRLNKGTNREFDYEVDIEKLPLSWDLIQQLIMLGSYADTDLVNFSKCLGRLFRVFTRFPAKLVDEQAYWQISNCQWLNLLEPINRRAK